MHMEVDAKVWVAIYGCMVYWYIHAYRMFKNSPNKLFKLEHDIVVGWLVIEVEYLYSAYSKV